MPRAQHIVSSLICGAMASACPGVSHMKGTTGGVTSTTSTSGSGSATSAGTANDGSIGDSVPTMVTAMMTNSNTSSSTTWPDDMPQDLHECDNFTQDCPEGQKCSAYASGQHDRFWDAVKCVDVSGTDQPGDTCISQGASSGIDTCIRGAMCWDVDINNVGTCYALCTGSVETPVCKFPGYCTIGAEGVLNLCFGYCSPLLQDCPVPGEVCYPLKDNVGFACGPDASGDAGQSNDECVYVNECKSGLTCADSNFVGMGCPPGAMSCCTPFCTFPGGACPNPDQKCIQFFEPKQFPPNNPYLEIGLCGVPG